MTIRKGGSESYIGRREEDNAIEDEAETEERRIS